MSTRTVRATIEIDEKEALAYAQFVKRVGSSDLLRFAADQNEADSAYDALLKIRDAIGTHPR